MSKKGRPVIKKKGEAREKKLGPLKDYEPRKVPHWFASAKEAFALIEKTNALTLHPEVIAGYFKDLTCEIFSEEKKDYVPKDLRTTFLSNALNHVGSDRAEEVRLAGGHEDLATTQAFYIKDTRELEDALYDPNADEAA